MAPVWWFPYNGRTMNPPENRQELLRRIPQVNELAELAGPRAGGRNVARPVLTRAVRKVLDGARASILSASGEYSSPSDLEHGALMEKVYKEVDRIMSPSLRKVINATGVVLHTNFGRSPLSRRALEAVLATSEGYSNLEYRVDSGERGSRQEHLEPILVELTGAEAAMVVNNNAAAVLLILAALARGREVIVSRGQLVEIGDSFRLPDIMRQSGAVLVEVGTTNMTRVSDYSNAVGPDTALIMRIHQSNFRIVGYTEEVPIGELVELGKHHSLPVVEDLGSGSMVDLDGLGLPGEHTARESISRGADLVTFSGDKLLGGPQAGVVAGKALYVDALCRHPLARALRVDKMTLAALEATLMEYLDPERAATGVPALKMMVEPEGSVKKRALRLKRILDRSNAADLEYKVVGDVSRAGGGSLPTAEIPTYCLSLAHPRHSAQALEERLRRSDPPVIGRLKDDRLILDMRTVSNDEVPVLGSVLSRIT